MDTPVYLLLTTSTTRGMDCEPTLVRCLERVHFLLRAVVRQLITITEPKGTGICGVPVEGVIKDHLNWAANCCLEFAQQRDGWLAALARARRLPLLSGWMIMMEPLSEVTCTRYGSLVASEVP